MKELEPRLALDAALVTDGALAFHFFARERKQHHVRLVTREGERTRGLFHIQNVNAYASRLKAWMARFKGVATAYLDNYLGWRRAIEQKRSGFNRITCITSALA